jgi:putative transposase
MRGYDGAKKLNGRKRHLRVDTGGVLLRAVVHPADVADREWAKLVLHDLAMRLPMVRQVWVDMGDQGHLLDWAQQTLDLTLTVVKRPRRWMRGPVGEEPPPATPWTVLPRRWVVERTFAWLGRNRRLSKDDEHLAATEEAWIYAAMTQLMVRRLAR